MASRSMPEAISLELIGQRLADIRIGATATQATIATQREHGEATAIRIGAVEEAALPPITQVSITKIRPKPGQPSIQESLQ